MKTVPGLCTVFGLLLPSPPLVLEIQQCSVDSLYESKTFQKKALPQTSTPHNDWCEPIGQVTEQDAVRF